MLGIGGAAESGGRRRSAPARRRFGGDWEEKPGLRASLEVWEGGSGFKRAMGWCSSGTTASWSLPVPMVGGGGCARARMGFYPFYRQPARGRAFLGHIATPGGEGFGPGALDGDGDGEVVAAEASGLRGRSGRSPARGKVGGE